MSHRPLNANAEPRFGTSPEMPTTDTQGLEQNNGMHESTHEITRRQNMKRSLFITLCLASAGLSGCIAPTPNFEENFGNSVRTVKALQTANPDASLNTNPVVGVDGVEANNSIRNYQDSFKAPPPVTNVINIGGGISGNGSQ